MSIHRVRKGLLCFAVAVAALIPSIAVSATALAPRAVSDAALATRINLTAKDLPASVNWSTSPPLPNGVSKQGRQAVACMKATGGVATKISPDLFGVAGEPGGVDTVDVASSAFSERGAGLPQVNSDVVFVTTPAQSINDLAAMNTNADLACFATAFAAGFGKSVKVTVTRLSRPTYGTGIGGVHVRFAITGLPTSFYGDVYCYVQARAEISVFVSESAPLSPSFASPFLAKIMTRAKSLLG